MITKFNLYLESYNTGSFTVNIDDEELVFKLKIKEKENGIKVFLLLNGKKYANVSVDLPDDDKLGSKEFFISPQLDKRIIKELVDQGFIQKGENKGNVAGEETNSYILAI